jgi:phospholipase C
MFRKIALGTSLLAVSIGANSCFADEPKADLNSVEHNDERHLKQFRIDQRFPANLPNQPFSIDAYVPIGDKTGDPIHRFYHQQAQTDGGLMDRFVAYSNMGPLVMGFYDGSKTKLWEYAQHYTLASG